MSVVKVDEDSVYFSQLRTGPNKLLLKLNTNLGVEATRSFSLVQSFTYGVNSIEIDTDFIYEMFAFRSGHMTYFAKWDKISL